MQDQVSDRAEQAAHYQGGASEPKEGFASDGRVHFQEPSLVNW
jgi:hypothetical protein